MGDQIDCCQRPANLGRKDLKIYRGINQKNNPKFKTSNLDEPDNFGSFKPIKNLDKNPERKGNPNFKSIYGNENEPKFPNFSEFDIEPVSEPVYSGPLPQNQPQYGNEQNIQQQTQINTDVGMNYINSSSPEYINNVSSQPVEYITSNPNEYIQVQKPVIYTNNNSYQPTSEYVQSPVTNYIEPYQNSNQYENYNINQESSSQYITDNTNQITTLPQYYESSNTVSYQPEKIETIYTPNQYNENISNPQTQNVQYSDYQPYTTYQEQTPNIYIEQQPPQIYVEPQSELENQEYDNKKKSGHGRKVIKKYIVKEPTDNGLKKGKKLIKKTKIIEYYSEEDEEEEDEENEENEQIEEEPNSSLYEEIKEQKFKNKKVRTKQKNKKPSDNCIKEEYNKKIKNIKKIQKQRIKSLEDKENESDNMDYESIKQKNKKIQDYKNKEIENQKDEEEFSGFQKEPKIIRESYANSNSEFEDINGNTIKNDNTFNKLDNNNVISLKNGMKLNGNFKKEEIVDINDIAEKEREDLFSGKTLKVASVEKKEETTGCQVPEFISNIFSKIF